MRFMVSAEKVEKVVNPPAKPTATRSFQPFPQPFATDIAMNMPSRREPETLMSNVWSGIGFDHLVENHSPNQ